MQYEITVIVDVLDAPAVIAAAKTHYPEIADETVSVTEALRYLIDPGAVPLKYGFEIVDSHAQAMEG